MNGWQEGVRRYLIRYGNVPEPANALHGGRRWDYVLTIPACNEPADFLESVLANVEHRRVLTIVTANVPEGASAAVRTATEKMAAYLGRLPDVLLIRRLDPPLPARRGVGLARALAADLAAALIIRGRIRCPWIFLTDADATLPDGYFDAAAAACDRATLVYPFRHAGGDPHITGLITLYELHLRHYVLGLRHARSAYGYHSLGSTIAIHAATYAAVRGLPRRNAGEDFYLLNKAAKVAPVACLADPVLTLHARHSDRVPFGTGPALGRIPENPEDYVSFPWQAFEDLAGVHSALQAWALGDRYDLDLPDDVASALAGLGWKGNRLFPRHSPGERRLRAVLEWFDGFRSMRFLRLRQQALPPAPLLTTLRSDVGKPGAGRGRLSWAWRRPWSGPAQPGRDRGHTSAQLSPLHSHTPSRSL